ncbi:sodium/calcium exchanger membrane region [Psychromonas ingrahamii 37]|uniref:Sodium/calcium exchanger membrane region n=1 Tax=Psychromonas ingrahamii (strain DSM 17664 / CCUG 51855 / 37) TaxID=357804 RepID=A1SUD1_PSYIN|nr:sodium:calcium antiporter [Psychromonas ingrahamii]ABM03096.1 sodium/calcium exchanger membrane region [Psychromonas ingrahamii 37]
MNTIENVWPFLLIIFSCYLLKYACDTFEQAASYLGRNFPPGVKGATVNAVGSSMPEMCVVIACLFWFNDPSLVMVALGVTAGSAIFNGCVIPALSIIMAKDEDGSAVKSIKLTKRVLIRDVFWVLTAEIALIIFLGFNHFTLWMAVVLNVIYVFYAVHLYIDSKRNREGDDEDVYEYEEIDDRGVFLNLITFNFNTLFFSNRPFTLVSSLVVLSLAIAVISGSSSILVEGVLGSASVLGVPEFFAGLIFGSAASSVPDLMLSVKDARKGEYEDAVANPLASNTFDTTIAFALPLLAWFLINGVDSLPLLQDDSLTLLRWSIVGITGGVAASLIFNYKKVTRNVAYFLLAMFFVWAGVMYALIG